jgi:hypothetical protein
MWPFLIFRHFIIMPELAQDWVGFSSFTVPCRRKCPDAVRQSSIEGRDNEHLARNADWINTTKPKSK